MRKRAVLSMKRMMHVLLAGMLMLFGTYAIAAGDDSKPKAVDSAYSIVRIAGDTVMTGCNGAIAGPDGALYVVHTGDSSVSRIDLKTLKIAPFVPSYAGAFYLDDVTADDKGNLYATGMSPVVGEVYRIDRQGMKSVIARGLRAPNGIQYNKRTGRLFMSECFQGNRVFELDPAGIREPRLLEKARLVVPEGFDFDPDTNDLIVPDMGTGKIYRVNPESGALTKIAGGFQRPVALKVGPDKKAYTQEISGALYRLSLDGEKKEKIAQLPPGLDNLAFAPDGRLYVTNWWDATVYEVATDGSGKFRTLFPEGINTITGVLLKNGKLWVADNIMIRSAEGGKYVKSAINPYAVTDNMPVPGILSDGPGDQILWLEPFAGTLAIGDPVRGGFRTIVGAVESLNRPVAMVMSGDRSTVYVAEYGSGKILSIGLDDGGKKILAEGLEGPLALAIIGDTMYVSEGKAARISKVDMKTGKTEIVVVGLGKFGALANDGRGNLLAMDDAGGKLVRIHTGNLALKVIAVGLPVRSNVIGHHPGLEMPCPMTVGPEGDIYLPTAGRGLVMLKKKR